ncbi:hypothetical protein [Nostoc sp. EfeVER01]|nr:hypothetical protein [Nostoc sp. EfeVER01]
MSHLNYLVTVAIAKLVLTQITSCNYEQRFLTIFLSSIRQSLDFSAS